LSGESYFIRQALASPPSPFEVRTINGSQIGKAPLRSYDVLVLVNPGEIDQDSSRLLKNYIDGGGSLFLTLGERHLSGKGSSPTAEQAAFLNLLPGQLMESRTVQELSLKPNPEIDNEEFAGIRSDYEWDKITVGKIVQPQIKEDGEPWILLSDGTP